MEQKKGRVENEERRAEERGGKERTKGKGVEEGQDKWGN